MLHCYVLILKEVLCTCMQFCYYFLLYCITIFFNLVVCCYFYLVCRTESLDFGSRTKFFLLLVSYIYRVYVLVKSYNVGSTSREVNTVIQSLEYQRTDCDNCQCGGDYGLYFMSSDEINFRIFEEVLSKLVVESNLSLSFLAAQHCLEHQSRNKDT